MPGEPLAVMERMYVPAVCDEQLKKTLFVILGVSTTLGVLNGEQTRPEVTLWLRVTFPLNELLVKLIVELVVCATMTRTGIEATITKSPT